MFSWLYSRLPLWKREPDAPKLYWQAAPIGGGGTVQLGLLTETQALAKVQLIKGENDPIAFVDTERGFIAYGKHPESAQ